MDETPKPEEIEDTLEDIPNHVRDVRLVQDRFQEGKKLMYSLVERAGSKDANEDD